MLARRRCPTGVGPGDTETNVDLGVKPQLVGQQASTGEIYAPYDEDIVQLAQSFM